jgi:hypothetical protein
VKLASLLHLPAQAEQEQHITIAAVKWWLEHHDQWLLILDNADDLAMVSDFLPMSETGQVLLTTRDVVAGNIANSVEVEKMQQEEGTTLLLRRTKLLAPDAPLAQAPGDARTQAEAIVVAMDGLPLALDQAGAYLEETGCSLSAYLERYQKHPSHLLQKRGRFGKEHPQPVATTWSLSFEQVTQQNPLAAELHRFCAFLSPDAIPEEMIVESAPELGPQLEPLATNPSLLDEAIALLRRFSLVRRKNNILSIHRLVQMVLKDSQTYGIIRKGKDEAR